MVVDNIRVTARGRYLDGSRIDYRRFMNAAKDYSKNVGEDFLYLYSKPYDDTAGNPWFYIHIFDALSLLKAMEIAPRGRVLDVGCGSGWLAEIVSALGFEVHALDPSEELLGIARERVESFARHLHRGAPRVSYHCTTLEECDLPGDFFDGILFYSTFHHIIDERKCVKNCFRMLRPGGIIGIHESAWLPGDAEMEGSIEAEMEKYCTLENPFTTAYADLLLAEAGFEKLERYYQVNGLYPSHMGGTKIMNAATARPNSHNVVTAVKPYPFPPASDRRRTTRADIDIKDSSFDARSRKIKLKVRLNNTGETFWPYRYHINGGYVTLALRQKRSAVHHIEALSRMRLPHPVFPGESITLEAEFLLPEGYKNAPWFVDLVNEGYFWFSDRGTIPPQVKAR